MVDKWNERVQKERSTSLSDIYQVSGWQRTQCQSAMQDVFSEGQEPCHVGNMLEEPAYRLPSERWAKPC